MTSKEIREIRKLYTKENCSVQRLCGCYVSGEKQKLASFSGSLLTTGEEEQFKYLDILKKCLSGTAEKNLFNINIPLSFETSDDAFRLLSGLRESGLKNEALLEMFYDLVIGSAEITGNFLILLALDTYDIPGKTALGDELSDASEESFTYMLCALCPVELGKPGLKFSTEEGWFMAIDRDWIAGAPATGFMYPAFNDRSTDLHASLWYARNKDHFQSGLLRDLFGTELPMTAEEKKEGFGAIVSDVCQDALDAETVKSVHETLIQEAEIIKNEPGLDPQLSKNDVRAILEKSGIADEELERFDTSYERVLGDSTGLDINTICSKRRFTVKNDSVELRISADRTDLIRFEEMDGRRCAIIFLEDPVEVNGIPV